MTALMVSFNLEWPVEMLMFFSYSGAAANASENIVSFDCLAEDKSYSMKIISTALSPLVVSFLAFIVWLIIGLFKRNLRQVLVNELITSIIVLLFLIHPTVTTVMFSVFACSEIEGTGKQWLMSDRNIECWDDEHGFLAVFIALPALWASQPAVFSSSPNSATTYLNTELRPSSGSFIMDIPGKTISGSS
jgi:hypothetical protein